MPTCRQCDAKVATSDKFCPQCSFVFGEPLGVTSGPNQNTVKFSRKVNHTEQTSTAWIRRIEASSKGNKQFREREAARTANAVTNGFVYLLRSGPYYKIGMSKDLDKRISQIKLQLPFEVEFLHAIQTDDPTGIEHYWHKRFSAKRANGEWFLLNDADVTAFCERKMM